MIFIKRLIFIIIFIIILMICCIFHAIKNNFNFVSTQFGNISIQDHVKKSIQSRNSSKIPLILSATPFFHWKLFSAEHPYLQEPVENCPVKCEYTYDKTYIDFFIC